MREAIEETGRPVSLLRDRLLERAKEESVAADPQVTRTSIDLREEGPGDVQADGHDAPRS